MDNHSVYVSKGTVSYQPREVELTETDLEAIYGGLDPQNGASQDTDPQNGASQDTDPQSDLQASLQSEFPQDLLGSDQLGGLFSLGF